MVKGKNRRREKTSFFVLFLTKRSRPISIAETLGGVVDPLLLTVRMIERFGTTRREGNGILKIK